MTSTFFFTEQNELIQERKHYMPIYLSSFAKSLLELL